MFSFNSCSQIFLFQAAICPAVLVVDVSPKWTLVLGKTASLITVQASLLQALIYLSIPITKEFNRSHDTNDMVSAFIILLNSLTSPFAYTATPCYLYLGVR